MAGRVFVIRCGFLLAAMSSAVEARATIRTFTVQADGPCAGTTSQATGSGTFTLDTDTGDVQYDITLVGLTPVQMHVHGPADACSAATTAPIAVHLETAAHSTGSYVIPEIHRILMLQGRHWVNVHTELRPVGEIAGRIIPDCLNACSGHGTCDLGVCTCDPGWAGEDCSLAVPIPTISGAAVVALAALLAAAGAVLIRRHPSM